MDAKTFAELLDASNRKNNEVLRNEIKGDIREELKTFREELKSEIKDMVSQSLQQTNEEINSLKENLVRKDEELASLREKTTYLEFSSRKKNIIIFRVAENERTRDNLLNGVSKLIREIADPSFNESEIDDVYRLGKPSNTPRPIMLVLNKSSKRTFLLSKRKNFMEKNIGIAEDLPKEVYEGRKPLYHLADQLRKEGKKVVFRMDKMLVDGKELTAEELDQEKASQERKRRLSMSPQSSQSIRNPVPKLNINSLSTQKSQASMEQFFSPTTKNTGVFDFASNM